ncbi:MAG: aspartyl/glutamyl-tRNA amidotransferase subunit C [Patescibacteria group bacterium]
MKIDIQQIEHLAKLAKISLTEAEKNRFAKDVTSIIDYFDQLNEINSSKFVIPTEPALSEVERVEGSQILNKVGEPFHSDEPKNLFSTDKTLAEAPELEANQIKVKAVFDR